MLENYYGTPKAYVQEQLSQGRDVILEIEIQGARKIKKKFPEAVLVFVTAPSMEVLRERLVGRGTGDCRSDPPAFLPEQHRKRKAWTSMITFW